MTFSKTTLVLNSAYFPINVIGLKRVLILLEKGKAEVVEYYEETYKTVSGIYFIPAVIRLHGIFRVKTSGVKFAKRRLFLRDKSCCCYCGKIITRKSDITIDHVIPASRGGKTTWENCVTACKKCNNYKANRTPEEANLFMVFQPYKPSNYSRLMMFDCDIKPEWELWLGNMK